MANIDLIISGNLTGFSRFYTSATANEIYEEAKFDFDYRNYLKFLIAEDKAYAISFSARVISVSLVVRSLDSFRRPGVIVFSVLMHRKQKVISKLVPQSQTSMYDLLNEIYNKFMERNFVNGMLNQNAAVLKQDYYSDILNNYELVSNPTQRNINSTLDFLTPNKLIGYVVPEDGNIASYLETPCRHKYSRYHHVFLSDKAPANIEESAIETVLYNIFVTNNGQRLSGQKLSNKIPHISPNDFEDDIEQDFTFQQVLDGQARRISMTPIGEDYNITYRFVSKSKKITFVLKDGDEEVPYNLVELVYKTNSGDTLPIRTNPFIFEGDELGQDLKLEITNGNYCIKPGYDILSLRRLSDESSIPVLLEKTKRLKLPVQKDKIPQTIRLTSNIHSSKIYNNVTDTFCIDLPGKEEDWNITIEIENFLPVKCSLHDYINGKPIQLVPKNTHSINQIKEGKNIAYPVINTYSAKQVTANVSKGKKNNLKKYLPLGIAASVVVVAAVVLYAIFGDGWFNGNSGKKTADDISGAKEDSTFISAKLTLLDADGDIIEKRNISNGLYSKFLESLNVQLSKSSNIKIEEHKDSLFWNIIGTINEDSIDVVVKVYIKNDCLVDTTLWLNGSKSDVQVKLIKRLSDITKHLRSETESPNRSGESQSVKPAIQEVSTPSGQAQAAKPNQDILDNRCTQLTFSIGEATDILSKGNASEKTKKFCKTYISLINNIKNKKNVSRNQLFNDEQNKAIKNYQDNRSKMTDDMAKRINSLHQLNEELKKL